MKLYINNVSHLNNDDSIQDVAGIAGYALSVKTINGVDRYIDLGNIEGWTKRHNKEIKEMMGTFVLYGFDVNMG